MISHKIFSSIHPEELQELIELDQKVFLLGNSLALSKCYKSLNYKEEYTTFVEKKGNYNPQFHYEYPELHKITMIKGELLAIQRHYQDHPLKSLFAQLLLEKVGEQLIKADLIIALMHQDYEQIDRCNKARYGEFDSVLIQELEEQLKTRTPHDKEHFGRILSIEEVQKRIHLWLQEHGYTDITLELTEINLARIMIAMGQNVTIKLSPKALIREHELPGLLAHELGTHLTRFLNGNATHWRILTNGTAYYKATEEGLAVYNERAVQSDYMNIYKQYMIHKRTYGVYMASLMNWQEMTELYQERFAGELKGIFNTLLRVKKGIQDTSIIHSGTSCYEDKVYLDGYRGIESLEKSGKNLTTLLVGKVKYEDLELCS